MNSYWARTILGLFRFRADVCFARVAAVIATKSAGEFRCPAAVFNRGRRSRQDRFLVDGQRRF